MISTRNTVNLYQIASLEMLEKAQLVPQQPLFSYKENDEIKYIELDDEFENTLFIHEQESNWSPNEHSLFIEQKFRFENPSGLFGVEGVTGKANKIGIAAHIHSKTTNIQKKIKFGIFGDTSEPIEFIFRHEFEKNSLRGELNIEFFLYLEDIQEKLPLQADQKGFRLSINLLPTIVIVIDGIGSTFPILEINDKAAPLWQVEKNWADPIDDPFDISTVHLKLNIAHPEFNRLKDGKTNLSRVYMGDIMSQVMAMVINDVLNQSEYNLNDADNATSDSIITIVKYWVETFNVNTTDYFTIINSIKKSLEESF